MVQDNDNQIISVGDRGHRYKQKRRDSPDNEGRDKGIHEISNTRISLGVTKIQQEEESIARNCL